jgi:hypothetical protein
MGRSGCGPHSTIPVVLQDPRRDTRGTGEHAGGSGGTPKGPEGTRGIQGTLRGPEGTAGGSRETTRGPKGTTGGLEQAPPTNLLDKTIWNPRPVIDPGHRKEKYWPPRGPKCKGVDLGSKSLAL